MNQRRHLSFVAAAATLMAAAPLSVLFSDWSWFIDSVFVVAVVCAIGLGTRALRLPLWVQPVAGVVGVALVVTVLSVRSQAILGIIPGPAAWTAYNQLLNYASTDIRTLGIPVHSDPGLLMLTTAGVGLVAVLVDFLAVGLRRPAVAGLPMLAVYAVPVAIDLHSVNFFAFAIGAAGYLWLLVTDNIDRVRMFGRRFTGEGKGVDTWEPSPLAAVGRRIAVGCVALAILLPLATPGFSKGLVGVLGTVGGDGDGSGNCSSCAGSNTVDLLASLAGQLNQNDNVTLAQVTTDDQQPGYLRFAVATQLTNRGFLTTTPNGAPISQGLPNPYLGNSNIDFTDHQATVTLRNLTLSYLPIFTSPVTGTLKNVDDRWRFDEDGDEIFTTQTHTENNMQYSFDYKRPAYTPEELRTAPPLKASDPLQRTMTQVPTDVPQVDNILQDKTTQATNEYDRVLNLYKWFNASHGFAYSTSTKPGTTGSDIGNFLTNKVGFCVQFAAALAWVVRAAGYPARVALGFTPGTQDDKGVWNLTNKNLHAWTEVYFAGFGWVPFDATPALGGTSFTTWAPDPNVTNAPGSGPSSGPGGDQNVTPGAPRTGNNGPTAGANAGGNGTGTGSSSDVPWWTLGSVLLVLLILATPFLTRTRLRRRRVVTGGATHRVSEADVGVVRDDGIVVTTERHRMHAVWDEFVDTLVDFGFGVDPAETPRSAAERVAGTPYLPSQVADDVRALGQAEERARYAARPGSTQSFAVGLRRIRRAFAERAPFRTRLRATLLPPSVTARWRSAVVGWFAQVYAGGQAVREGFVRAVNVRSRLASSRR